MIELKELFTPVYGVNLEFNKMTEAEDGIPFVGRTSNNNGIVGFVEEIEDIAPNPAMTISLSASGSVMESFLQEKEYYSGRDLYYLIPKASLSKNQLLYYCMVLRANKYRYNYGRQANKTLSYIKIPSPDEIPDYVETVSINKPDKASASDIKLSLTDEDWKWFQINDLFCVAGTKSHTKSQIQEFGGGGYPYVVTSSQNNGVDGFYNHFTDSGGVLTVDSATVGTCFYQPLDFSASDHVEKLIPKFKMSVYIALFLQTIINKEQFRYGYGRKFSQTRIKETKIKLPTKSNGAPDWQFMEDYIKSLPYSSNLGMAS